MRRLVCAFVVFFVCKKVKFAHVVVYIAVHVKQCYHNGYTNMFFFFVPCYSEVRIIDKCKTNLSLVLKEGKLETFMYVVIPSFTENCHPV